MNAWIELTTRWRHTEKPSLFDREISSPTNAMALKNLETAKKNKAGIRSREAKILQAGREMQAKPTACCHKRCQSGTEMIFIGNASL
jgi:hypothetical protein